ncbi:MAG TPA: hypothetical protein VKR31_14780 [Rhizomicrobium sp.]|nr:hypothetical protein [Rhizomicrobium sp.]
MTFVTVYKFKIWNTEIGQFVLSLRMGTRAAIESAGGEIMEGSATEVPVTELDRRGFTTRNTGN